MPRESVFGAQMPYGEHSSARTQVGVTWSKEAGHVQIYTCLFNDDLRYVTADGVSHESEGEEKSRREWASQGLYVDLDREGINKLVRNLRRARDQAFGRDE